MNHAEAVTLCRVVAAYCPQQHFDEWTPDSWHDLLGDLRFDDAKEAAADIARSQPFCAPAEIRARVRIIRDQRIAHTPLPDPPPGLGDDEVGYRRWLGEQRRRIADGETPEVAELPQHDVKGLIEGARPFREVPPA